MYFNNYNPYSQQYGMPQIQQPQQYQQPVQQMQNLSTLNGQMVDSIESARSKDIDMSGNPRYYPNINGSEIYVKQLQADGTCPVITYKREIPQAEQPKDETLINILSEISSLKNLIAGWLGEEEHK